MTIASGVVAGATNYEKKTGKSENSPVFHYEATCAFVNRADVRRRRALQLTLVRWHPSWLG